MAKALIVSLVLIIIASFIWIRYGDRISHTDALPESYALLEKFEKEGMADFEALSIVAGRLGPNRKLSEFKGKLIILSFWASWCGPCVDEFPSLMQLAARYPNDIVVVGVSADQRQEDITAFLEAVGNVPLNFINLWDPSTRTAVSYGTDKIPENYIINRDFKLARKLSSSIDWASQDSVNFIQSLL